MKSRRLFSETTNSSLLALSVLFSPESEDESKTLSPTADLLFEKHVEQAMFATFVSSDDDGEAEMELFSGDGISREAEADVVFSQLVDYPWQL